MKDVDCCRKKQRHKSVTGTKAKRKQNRKKERKKERQAEPRKQALKNSQNTLVENQCFLKIPAFVWDKKKI